YAVSLAAHLTAFLDFDPCKSVTGPTTSGNSKQKSLGDLCFVKNLFSASFLPTIILFLSSRKCLPTLSSSISPIETRFLLVKRSLSFFEYSSHVKRHPPAGDG